MKNKLNLLIFGLGFILISAKGLGITNGDGTSGKNNIIGTYVSVLLKIKDYQISATELNSHKILNLTKQNIIDIYDEKEKYNIVALEKVIKEESYDRLKSFFIFNGELQ